MTRSTKIAAVAVMAALGLASAAAPSFAQSRHDRYDRDYRTDYANNEMRMDLRLRQLENQYNSGLRKGGFDRGEQRRLRAALNTLSRQADQFERSGRGVDDRELAVISDRATDLWREMSVTAHDDDYRRRY